MRQCFAIIVSILIGSVLVAQNKLSTREVSVANAWAGNSVNTVVFRKNSLITFGDTQFVAFYDSSHFVVLGKRCVGSGSWELVRTKYSGNVKDAHNTISIMIDGKGFLHLSFGQHNTPLQYCKSIQPGSLVMGEKTRMIGNSESSVTYPEFYQFPNGDLLFLYRDGSSGNGNLVMNRYDTEVAKWIRLHDNLINGEGQRNAYWQTHIDTRGTIHISWVWRESPDVASNHDICYARSKDGGRTWERSTGTAYFIPITENSAEYAARISQNSELINQTSMATDDKGNPYIATYWRDSSSGVPQYHIVYTNDGQWKTEVLHSRQTAFTLSGGGTKRIPIARPQIIIGGSGAFPGIAIIFRDEERGNKVSVAIKKGNDTASWKIHDLTNYSVGSWEPTYDPVVWKERKQVHLFVQKVEQRDGEGIADTAPSMVNVLEWTPEF